jgi:putative restriction endonuclease
MQRQIPVIYFLGVSPGRYQPIDPAFVVGWHPERLPYFRYANQN